MVAGKVLSQKRIWFENSQFGELTRVASFFAKIWLYFRQAGNVAVDPNAVETVDPQELPGIVVTEQHAECKVCKGS